MNLQSLRNVEQGIYKLMYTYTTNKGNKILRWDLNYT